MSIARKFKRAVARFRSDERGMAALEFAVVSPAFMLLFISAIESGLLMTRQVMLERGLDMAVREVRLATGTPPDYNTLRKMICNGAGILDECVADLRLEMVPVDPRGTVNIPRKAQCVDRAKPFEPVRQFVPGQDNELVYLRACIKFKPIFPTAGLGFQISDVRGEYKIVADNLFVAEPSS